MCQWEKRKACWTLRCPAYPGLQSGEQFRWSLLRLMLVPALLVRCGVLPPRRAHLRFLLGYLPRGLARSGLCCLRLSPPALLLAVPEVASLHVQTLAAATMMNTTLHRTPLEIRRTDWTPCFLVSFVVN